MEMEPKFDLEKFRDRCVREFCELTEKPTDIVGHNKSQAIKHYAPLIEKSRLEGWQRAGQHLILQTNFAAPFIFDKETAFGVIEIHRPIMVIKFGNECYWRNIPKRHAVEAVEQAKKRNIFKKLKTVPLPKRTEIKEQTVESFIERIRLKALNPSPDCVASTTHFFNKDNKVCCIYNFHWHESASPVMRFLKKEFSKNVKLLDYYQTFPHLSPDVNDFWIVIEHKEKQDLYIEYRINKNIFVEKAPAFIKEQLKQYAKNKARLFLAPTSLRLQKEKSNLDFLTK